MVGFRMKDIVYWNEIEWPSKWKFHYHCLFSVTCFFVISQLRFIFSFSVTQDQNWPFKEKKKFEILLLLSSKRIILFMFKGLKPTLLYAINLTSVGNLIKVIMISLMSCQCFLSLVFNVLCPVLNSHTPQNPENFNLIKSKLNFEILWWFFCGTSFGW